MVVVEYTVAQEYLEMVGLDQLDPVKLEIVDIEPTDIKRFERMENERKK